MELTEEKIKFLDKVCVGRWILNSEGKVDVDGSVNMANMKLTEIPVKFGRVAVSFDCSFNNLTTLKNTPNKLIGCDIHNRINIMGNNLKGDLKNLKEEDFPLWDKLFWSDVLEEYPFLINIGKKYLDRSFFEIYLQFYPQTKLYLKD